MLFYRIYVKKQDGSIRDAYENGYIEHSIDFESVEYAGKYLDNNYHPKPDKTHYYEFVILPMWS